MLQCSIQSLLEVTSSGCYNVASRASRKLIEIDVTTYIQSVLEVTSSGCCNVASTALWELLETSVKI